MTDDRGLFLEALRMLGRSAARLEQHHRALAPLMPLDRARLESLDELELTRIEAMMKKFDQFTDDLRRRAFRGVLALAAEPFETMSQRQVLDRLETLGCVESGDRFLDTLRLRNDLAHEYPEQQSLQADAITNAWRTIPHLLAMLDRVREYVVSSGLVEPDELPPRRP